MNAAGSAPSLELSRLALDALAARFRGTGLCLVVLSADGTVQFTDPKAATFLQRFAIPVLSYGECGQQFFGVALPITSLDGEVNVCEPMPGTIMAAFAYTDRRQLQAIVALMGRSESFRIDAQTQKLCTQLGLDPEWLRGEAAATPAFDALAIGHETRQLANMLRDQLRLDGLNREVESLSGQLANTYEELSLIYRLSGGMKVNRSTSEFFKQACLDVMDVVGVRGMGVVLKAENLEPRGPVLYGATSLPPGAVHKLSDQMIERLKKKSAAILVNDLSADGDFAWIAQHAQRLLAVPLQRDSQVLGCLFCFDKSDGDFDTVDAKLLTSIANESAIYLENAILFQDVRGLMMGLLHSLVSAVDAKDTYTCGHSERVALIGREIAVNAGLPQPIIERTYMAGLLHDVGKIGVPEHVLQKPGKLDDQEFALMKQHPEIGGRILRDVKQLEDVLPGVLHHHERYDGRGYPSKLAGEAIPLLGRIICLADSFDAMTSNRTYRRALPFEVAMVEIKNSAGAQFDPQLTEAFIRIGEPRLRELTSGHHEQASKLIELHTMLRVA
ncbi:MAG TPA: HD domain-containing phosphohydrolase [Tepidisphaeraceae bacterium]|jgi:HD-GYP domain-containing protein (c-di-GMP phosphodiesterase class II)